MAIDTNNEKLALITYLQPWNTPVPISSDGLGQDDKQHLLACYPGILWGEAEEGGEPSQGSSAFHRLVYQHQGRKK